MPKKDEKELVGVAKSGQKDEEPEDEYSGGPIGDLTIEDDDSEPDGSPSYADPDYDPEAELGITKKKEDEAADESGTNYADPDYDPEEEGIKEPAPIRKKTKPTVKPISEVRGADIEKETQSVDIEKDKTEKEIVQKKPVQTEDELIQPQEVLKQEITPLIIKQKEDTPKQFENRVKEYNKLFEEMMFEVSKVVIGQKPILRALMQAILVDGHCLVEGIPGIAKTTLIRTLASITGCAFQRIQFTPDLLPTDIIGITTYDEKKGFYTLKGPIFANFILGDEINRAPPKVQSALLESMQERQVTIGRTSYNLPKPFFVMATQNPVEQLGTYPLPEAQIDRFMYKLLMTYPNMDEEKEILHKNITLHKFEEFRTRIILTPSKIIHLQQDVKKIYLDPKIEDYIVKIIDASRNPQKYKINLGKYIDYGASPRASIGLFISAKANALMGGKTFVTPHDVKTVAPNLLRHRIILNYEGQAEEIDPDDIIKEILDKVPIV